jgi:hypothetical protein
VYRHLQQRRIRYSLHMYSHLRQRGIRNSLKNVKPPVSEEDEDS